ncbi:MAG: 50S ribosomal protein L23 [Candidatus Aenigmarchaeota archaeon]|nr:50S ribosomal protein L23 [Candidatus Aenigmarchaeota archaeon]
MEPKKKTADETKQAGRSPEQPKAPDPWKVLVHPHMAEKSMNMVELQNRLVFIVDRRADKAAISAAVEKAFNVKVVRVNTVVTTKGVKKAFIKLAPQFSAGEIASRMGMI